MTNAKGPTDGLQQLRVVVYREGDLYMAQCLEYDIATQARDIDELLDPLDLTIDAECAMSRERGGKPFEGIAPAPNYFHGLWENRYASVTQINFPIAQHFDVEVVLAKAA